jgi:hypothetical protein
MVDQSASGAAVAPADRAAVTRRVRDAGADATSQEAVGPGSAGATDRGVGPRLMGIDVVKLLTRGAGRG